MDYIVKKILFTFKGTKKKTEWKYVWSDLDMGNFFFSVKGQTANRLDFVGPSDLCISFLGLR